MVLVTRGGGFADQHVADSIGQRFQTETLAIINEKLRYLLFLSRRTGNLREFGEILPNAFWFKISHISKI